MHKFVNAAAWGSVRKTVAVVEILGASWSVLAAVHLFLTTPGILIPWSFLIITLGWFSLVGLAGVLLLRDKRSGWTLSVVAQALQLLQITAGSVAFRLLAGPQATVSLVEGHLRWFVGMTSSIGLWREQGDPALIAVNFVPLLLLGALAQRPQALAQAHAA